MDPASGFKNIKINEFMEEWDNIIIVLRPYKRIINEHINNSLFSFILTICNQEKELFSKLFVDSLCIALLSLISALYW